MPRPARDPFAEQQEIKIRLLKLLEAAVCGAAQFIANQALANEEDQADREEEEHNLRRRAARRRRRAEREDEGADTETTQYSDDGIPWVVVRCEPPADEAFEDPASIQPGDIIEAEVIALAEPAAAPAQLEPVPSGTLLRLIPELPADHEAQASYRELAERLRTLADLAIEHPSEALAQRVTEVWQSFQAFNRFKISDPERYPAIRDYLRGTIKPFCSRIIADCAEGSAG